MEFEEVFYSVIPNSNVVIKITKGVRIDYNESSEIKIDYYFDPKTIKDIDFCGKEEMWEKNDYTDDDYSISIDYIGAKRTLLISSAINSEEYAKFVLCLMISDLVVNYKLDQIDKIKICNKPDVYGEDLERNNAFLKSISSEIDATNCIIVDLSTIVEYCNTSSHKLDFTPRSTFIELKMKTFKYFIDRIDINFRKKFEMKITKQTILIETDNKNNTKHITKFLDDQYNYISKLSVEDKLTTIGYTMHGDKGIGLLLKNKIFNFNQFQEKMYLGEYDVSSLYSEDDYFPYYSQIVKLYNLNFKNDYFEVINKIIHSLTENEWINILKLYISDLKRIINGAPPLKNNLILYRGAGDAYYNKPTKKYKQELPDEKHIEQLKTFSSLSLDFKMARKFTNSASGIIRCCILRYTLLKGSKVLFLGFGGGVWNEDEGENESEVLLNIGSYNIIKESYSAKYEDGYYNVTNILHCKNDKYCIN